MLFVGVGRIEIDMRMLPDVGESRGRLKVRPRYDGKN